MYIHRSVLKLRLINQRLFVKELICHLKKRPYEPYLTASSNLRLRENRRSNMNVGTLTFHSIVCYDTMATTTTTTAAISSVSLGNYLETSLD